MQTHALIIGGTRGLGKAVVNRLREKNYLCSVMARSLPIDIQNDSNILYLEADLHEQDICLERLKETIRARGKINYLIFLQRYRGAGDCWAGELDITLHATRHMIDGLKDEFHAENAHDSSIVMVSSMAGKFSTTSQPLSYSVAKAGLNQMVQHYAAELGHLGVRVNAVSPCSFIKEESQQFYDENKKLHALYKKIIPLQRMCRAEDVANVIAF